MKQEGALSLADVKQVIRQLNLIDLELDNYNVVKELVDKLLSGVAVTTRTYDDGIGVYRSIIYGNKPKHTKQLGYPPAEVVSNFQRCNPPNMPKFYCSSHHIASMCEVNPKIGDTVYLSYWSSTKATAVFFVPQMDIPTNVPSLKLFNTTQREVIAAYLETRFTQRIHEAFSSEYKITSAVTECLVDEKPLPIYGSRKGIGYPSVVHPVRFECFAFGPDVIDDCFNLENVEENVIVDINRDVVTFECKDYSSCFTNDEIHWLGKPKDRGSEDNVFKAVINLAAVVDQNGKISKNAFDL